MGLFDVLKGKLGSAGDAMELAAHYPALKDALLDVLQKKDLGGVQGLVDKFKGQGLGEIAASWVSTGGNLPASAQQIMTALGPTVIRQISEKTGLDSNKVAAGLTFVLPLVIDKLTPKGNAPDESGLKNGLDMLKNLKF